ncbi:MAG: TatD family hydrolase, partial [Candidatus Heimdallarchaeota archaeon]|nr:TatD family hydrolase [Candidatus Heimdallarchaeota archaeon]
EPHQFEFAWQLDEANPNYIFTTLGFAPQRIKDLNYNETVKLIMKFPNIVAVGEIGLDYHWITDSFWQKKQKETFISLIELANTLVKPIVVHSRKAETDSINLLAKYAEQPVLMHCFAGNISETERIIDQGWMISIPTAVVNRKKHRKIARKIPLENIVVETDTPYLSPIPGKRNEPANVRYAIEEIAKLKDISIKEIDEVTTQNTIQFYRIKKR